MVMGRTRLRHIRLEAVKQDHNKTLPQVSDMVKILRMLQRVEISGQILQDPELKKFLLNEENTKFDLLLLGYLFNEYLLGVAAHFHCPVAAIWPGQPIGFINSLIGNPEERWYVTQPYDHHQRTGWGALAFGVFENFVDFLALEIMRGTYDTHFPQPLYPSLAAMRENVSLVLCNHYSISEGPITPHVPGIVEIGGIQMLAQSEELPEPLKHIFEDLSHDVIYLSLGSRVKWLTFPSYVVDAFFKAFEQLSSSYTILWTYDGDCGAFIKNLSHIICASWFPQNAILAQEKTKLFITHGGKASITEALYHGVPMLGLPIFGDQRPNVQKMVNQKHGLQMDLATLNSEQLLGNITELMHDMTYSKNIKNMSQRYRDRPLTARESAIFWLEYIIRHKGATHMRSPLVHLNALQYYLIDIYALIIFVFYTFIVICNWLEKKITVERGENKSANLKNS